MVLQRIAVVGAGNWGKNIIRVCHELAVLSVVCDLDSFKALSVTKDYGIVSKSWADILLDKNVTAVAIAVPVSLHAKFIKEALLANKHVFVEKPLATDYSVAQELCILAKKKSKVLMVGHILQYHEAYIKLKQMVISGAIGQIRYIESTRLHLGPIRYDAGIVWELLPHDASMILGLVDEELMDLKIFHQKFNSTINYYNANQADILDINMEFHNKIKVRICASWLYPKKEQKFLVVGTKGTIIFEDTMPWEHKLRLSQYDNNMVIDVSIIKLEPLKAEMTHFINCINNNTIPRTDGYEAAIVVKLLQQIETNFKLQMV